MEASNCYDEGKEKMKWIIVGAYPIKYKPPDFNAKSNEPAIETLEIHHKGFTFVT